MRIWPAGLRVYPCKCLNKFLYFILKTEGNERIPKFRLTTPYDPITAIEKIHDVFRKLDPLNPAGSWFVDDSWRYNYRNVNFVGVLAAIFAALAIFLTCLGVVGLAAYTAEQRTKEIAIRKILGATVASLLLLLSNYFVRAAIFAVLISSPIAWLALDNYLQEFYYRIDVPWWVVPAAAFGMLVITLIIVIMQTMKTARANPVNGLKID